MVEDLYKSAFGKLRYKKFQIIEVLQSLGYYTSAQNFLLKVNKESRQFLIKNFNTIERDFTNKGLIVHKLTLN